MKYVVVLVTLLIAGTCAEPIGDSDNSEKFGSGHIELLKNISDTLDVVVSDKKTQHKQILDVGAVQHETLKKERTRLHEELKKDRAKQFEDTMDVGDKQHEELKTLLMQVMKNIESTDAFKLGQVHMDLIKKIKKTIEDSSIENKKQAEELAAVYGKRSGELKQLKDTEAKQITDERNRQFSTLNNKRISQEEEIKKILQQVLAKLDVPRNCHEAYLMNIRKNGIYLIKPDGMADNFYAYCDMENDGGGWTVIQRRGDFGNPDSYFYQTWAEFKKGFGKLIGEFWIGNEALFQMTKAKPFQLRIEMKDIENATTKALFGKFQVASEGNFYRLTLGDGAVGQSDTVFLKANGNYFSTSEQRRSCNNQFYGGWWYNGCNTAAILNGLRRKDRTWSSITFDGVTPLSAVVMKIKPSYD